MSLLSPLLVWGAWEQERAERQGGTRSALSGWETTVTANLQVELLPGRVWYSPFSPFLPPGLRVQLLSQQR